MSGYNDVVFIFLPPHISCPFTRCCCVGFLHWWSVRGLGGKGWGVCNFPLDYLRSSLVDPVCGVFWHNKIFEGGLRESLKSYRQLKFGKMGWPGIWRHRNQHQVTSQFEGWSVEWPVIFNSWLIIVQNWHCFSAGIWHSNRFSVGDGWVVEWWPGLCGEIANDEIISTYAMY